MQLMSTSDNALVMYTTTWCGYCVRLKRLMQREGIEFREVDIEGDPAAADLVMQANGGNRTVPTLAFPGGATLTNPSLDEVKAQLAQVSGV
jgi:mycoredoxin